MCSPLVMAVTRMSARAMTTRLVYNAGRILTYGMMGAIAGMVGGLFDLTPFQKTLSLITGAFLVIMGLSGNVFRIPFATPLIARFTGYIKQFFGVALKKKTPLSTFILGTLNGFLPCGLTYIALAYSISAPDAINGFVYMVAFGAGTLPAMVGLPMVANPLLNKLHISLPKLNAVLLITAGLLLVARNFIHIHVGHPLPLEVHPAIPLCR
jgi:sulfite exporter TauE/SafE